MRNICLTFCFLFHVHVCFGQLTITPDYLNMPSTYNPASLGVNLREVITTSIYSKKSFPNEALRAPRFDEIIGPVFYQRFQNKVGLSYTAKNIYFLGYHKTLDIGERMAITVGAQVQVRQDAELSLTSPQTFGITANSHFQLKSRRKKTRYLSNGIQIHLHYFNANKTMVDLLYNEHLIIKPATIEELSNKISNLGYSLSYNLNFHSYLDNKKAFTFGLSASTTKERVVNNMTSTELNGLYYRIKRFTGIKSFYSFQKVLNDQFSLELQGSFSSYAGSLSIGTGFRINSKSIFRLNAGIFSDSSTAYGLLFLKLETGRYIISSTLGFDTIDDDNLVQITCSYILDHSYTPTLLRLN